MPGRRRFASVIPWTSIAALALILLILGVAPRSAHAIDPSKPLSACTVDIWRSRDGLPGAWVRALAQTPDGYLWIATQEGLVRYGGGRLLHLRPDPSADIDIGSASDLTGLFAARDGTLWLSPTRGPPICVRGDHFAGCFPAGQRLPDGARIIDVQQDDSGAIWIATPDAIYRFADGQLQRRFDAAAWAGASLTKIQPERDGRLWVGTGTGLYRGQGPSLARQLGPDGPIRATVSAIGASAGRTWVVADGALIRIEGERTTVFGASEGLVIRRPTQVLEDQDGNVWVASRYGLIRFQPGRGARTFTRADGLPDDDVSALFEDREGSLWVGTRGGGLAQFTDRTVDGQSGPPSLRDQWISTVAEDADGALWIGTVLGLTRWQRENAQERTYTRADGLPGEQVLSVLPSGAEGIWVGTDRGLARWRDGRIDVPIRFNTAVTSLYRDPQGVLWIGAADGLARLQDGRIERIPPDDSLRGIAPAEIRSIQTDDRGVLWVSSGGRLLRLAKGRLGQAGDPDEPTGRIRAIHRDPDGTLWFGTHDGLVRRRQGRWRIFGAAEGLARGDLYQVVGDDLGFLWTGASQGILRISRSSLDEVADGRRTRLDVVSFETSDQRREVGATRTRQPGVWKGHDGRLWFATGRGVVTVIPRHVRVNALPPPVRIEEAFVDGQRAVLGSANHFPPGAGALELHFAAITLLEPQKAQHRYFLEGFDRDWIEAGTRRVAYYTNLRPGRYRFRVQGSNADGVWNQTGDTLELTLAPHIHQTWWFYALCVLAAAALVLSFHRLRLGQLHERYAATLAERTRVARELHDSLLQGMAATVLHLRALRKRFSPATERASAESVTAEIKDIEEVVTANMEETRRFVWDLREQPSAATALGPALTALVRRLAPAPGIEARVLVEGTAAPLPQHVHRELLRITQEAVANALTHGQARHLEVRLRHQDEGLQLSISDDGRGFDPERVADAEAGHFGLTGMRERAAALGTFVLDSRPGQGTRITVTINRRDFRDG